MRILLIALLVAVAGDDPGAALAELTKRRDESTLGYVEKYEAFRPEFEAFVAAHPGTEEALTAKLWLFQQTWWQRKAGTMEAAAAKILEEILAGWPESMQLVMIPEYHYVLARDAKAAVFERLGEISPHREVKAAALFGLARLGDGAARFAKLASNYGDVPWRLTTYGAIADAYLHPHPKAALEVGQMAPEIEGTDLDGKAMKLSDYRGKVVLLDFWGDW